MAIARVGFEHFKWWRSALLLSLNTWTSHVLTAGLVGVLAAPARRGDALAASEARRAVQTVGLYFSLRLACVMLCALIHRRHLMVWGIFCPKFVFEAAGTLVLDVLLILFVH